MNPLATANVARAVLILSALIVAPLHAIRLSVSASDVERALSIARGSDGERTRFHAPYITPINSPAIHSVEIVSEFRRLVLAAEEGIQKGDRLFAYSVRLVQESVSPWRGRVAVIARLRFHPHNTYVEMPDIRISLDGPGATAAFIGVSKQPLLAFSSAGPGEHIPILGAVAEGVFDAAIVGQTERNVSVKVDGREVTLRRLDFASVE